MLYLHLVIGMAVLGSIWPVYVSFLYQNNGDALTADSDAW